MTPAKDSGDGTAQQGGPEELRTLLEFIHQARGFDFSGYKRTSLERRMRKRMSEVGVETYPAYQDYLEANPHEFAELSTRS